jgi:tetratricopeptide (TPR) repeat protein
MTDINHLLERAELLLDQGRYKDAELQIKQALSQDPDHDYALGLLGRCYVNNGRYDEAIVIIQQAIALDPNDSFYFYLLGFAYYHKNQHVKAIEYLQHAIKLYPYHAEYFGLMAHVLIEDRAFEAGLHKANEGLAVDAESITCLNARSIALNKLKRTEDAIATMQDALAQDPDNAITHTTVGWNFLEKGNYNDAQHHFMEALRINPNQAGAKAGLKESLKSKLPPYRWLLQYSFWVQRKTKRTAVIIPIVIYVLFRVIVGLSSTLGLVSGFILALMVGAYILFVLTSWTVNSIANFFLLFHRIGKYALTVTEKWSAISAVSSIITGLVLIVLSRTSFLGGGDDIENLIVPGIVFLTLALPLGNIQYPVNPRGQGWREWFGVSLVAIGLLSALTVAFIPGLTFLFVIYLIGFLIYNWAGLAR